MLRLIQAKPRSPERNKKPDAVDDQALFERIIAGDNSAFEALYKLYYPRLFRFMLRMTRQPETVEELIQETMFLVWSQPERYNHDSKLSTWIFGIAYHKALKSLSKGAQRANEVALDDYLDELSDPGSNVVERLEAQDWLQNALASLSAEQRALIELTFYHGLAYQDIGNILGCPENTVKTRMFHARKKLQAFAEAQEN